ncbi:MAG: hypothetical protein ACXACX_04355 [Candidatus Hodarchaeales archaeon]|jgi:hypothetical protein
MNKLFTIFISFLFLLLLQTGHADKIDGSGTIDTYVFTRSIPQQMTVGDSYKILLKINNDGSEPAIFKIILKTNVEYFYPPIDSGENLVLNPGGSLITRFYITPIKPKIGEVNITAKLYKIDSNRFILQDESTVQVLSIKTRYWNSELLSLIAVLLVAVSTIFIIHRSIK